MRALKQRPGFTLVELLVVIGIIALLISILLPALNAARRSANAVKCATQLREIGNAYRLYALNNNNYYPPALITPASPHTYTIEDVTYPAAAGTRYYGAYWFNFINRYYSKTVVGAGTSSALTTSDARKTIVWGCSAWDGFAPLSGMGEAYDVNPVQTGFGMNGYPTFTAEMTSNYPPAREYAYDAAWTPASRAGFIKANIWGRRSAERALVADSKLWLVDSGPVSAMSGGVPRTGKMVPTQYGDINQNVTSNETNISMWRHSKLPSKNGSFYNPNNSKTAFNILYVDGHVNTETEPKLAYTSVRMKFPG